MARVKFQKVGLKIPVTEVVEKLEDFRTRIDSELNDQESAKKLEAEIIGFIKNSIEAAWCSWLNEIGLNQDEFHVPGSKATYNPSNSKSKLKMQLNGILFELYYFDEYANPELIKLEKRENFKVEEIVNFTLRKLYVLRKAIKGNIPLYQLLGGNGITLIGSLGDSFENYLYDRGFIEKPYWYSDAMVQLSVEGVQYVEENLLDDGKEFLRDSPDEMQEIITALSGIELEIKKLVIIGQMGSVELFEEIQDLKEALPNLKKKQWHQLLFGKVLDLLLKESIDSQTARTIFQMILGKVKHLIKGSLESVTGFLN